MKYKRPDRPTYIDFADKESYKSKQKRERNKILKWSVISLVILVLLVLLALRFKLMTHCVEASGGFHARYECGNDKCCEKLPAFNPNASWTNQ